MSGLMITKEMTDNSDYVLLDDHGFPMLYFGMGSYSSELDIRSQAVMTGGGNEVHLVYVGRYTSMGGDIRILCNMDHDYRSVYMGVIPGYADASDPNDYRKKVGQNHRFMKEKGMVIIGNDVWIGNNVTIIADVIIGNGAVIGAGSVVTKDVPPYTIWAGNPARQIKNRFDEDTAQKLQEISWWEFSKERLLEIKEDMQGEPEVFVQKYWNNNLGKSPKQNLQPSYLAFFDIETDYSTFGKILEQFVARFSDGAAKLTLCYYRCESDEEILAASLSEIIDGLCAKRNLSIALCGIEENDDERMIAQADCFILGRDRKNIMRISYAFKHRTRIISGVNEPINWD